MKNYVNFIKESFNSEIVIKQCIETLTFKPLLHIKELIPGYFNENFYLFNPSTIAHFINFCNNNNIIIDSKKINGIYNFIHEIFNRLEKKYTESNPKNIYFCIGDVIYAETDNDNDNKQLWYSKDKIYNVLFNVDGLSVLVIDPIIIKSFKEYFDIDVSQTQAVDNIFINKYWNNLILKPFNSNI